MAMALVSSELAAAAPGPFDAQPQLRHASHFFSSSTTTISTGFSSADAVVDSSQTLTASVDSALGVPSRDDPPAAAAAEVPTSCGGGLVTCFGEMLIDFVPTVAGVSLAEAPAFKKAPGGAPANVAVGVARLGGRSAFVGKVGDDEFGHMLADILKQNDVDDGGLLFDKEARTALAFVTLRSDGEREFMFFRHPSADMLLQRSELNVGLIQRSAIFHYGSISLIAEPCKSAHLAAMRIARDAGAVLSYDPNLRLPLWPSAAAAREGILSIWHEADIAKVSEDEIAFLTSCTGGKGTASTVDVVDEGARKLMHPTLKLLLVTEGRDGCRYYTKDFSGKVKGLEVKTVDTTGAGDAFVAGVLSQLAKDLSLLQDEGRLREALLYANACGAITTTERGAIPALPDTQAVLKLLCLQASFSTRINKCIIRGFTHLLAPHPWGGNGWGRLVAQDQ